MSFLRAICAVPRAVDYDVGRSGLFRLLCCHLSAHRFSTHKHFVDILFRTVINDHNGETVSVDGTHLGHNLPDNVGNRFCINLVSISGFEGQEIIGVETEEEGEGDSGDEL